MPEKRIAGAVLTILLLASILSAVYLALDREVSNAGRLIKRKSLSFSKKPSIGIVEIYGEIYASSEGGFMSKSGFQNTLDTLKGYREDDRVKAVIIRINSPGGTIGAVQEITQEIARLREAGKPVVASVADIAASGGYYIASACDEIVVNDGSVLGSIGVIFVSPDFSELMKKIGMNIETIKSGPYKDAGSFHRPFSQEEKKLLGELVDDAYEQFVSAVSKGRGIPDKKVRELAKGQIFTGRMAKKLGLADTTGDLTVAKERAERLLGIEESVLVKQPQPNIYRILRLISQKSSLSEIIGQKRLSGLAYLYNP
ncbi:MAG: signal peptide peptidase SppA [Elusimicrobiota bacterium]